jgi:hypothetical protein
MGASSWRFFAVSLFGARGDVGATQMQYSDFRAKVARAASMRRMGEQRISGHSRMARPSPPSRCPMM